MREKQLKIYRAELLSDIARVAILLIGFIILVLMVNVVIVKPAMDTIIITVGFIFAFLLLEWRYEIVNELMARYKMHRFNAKYLDELVENLRKIAQNTVFYFKTGQELNNCINFKGKFEILTYKDGKPIAISQIIIPGEKLVSFDETFVRLDEWRVSLEGSGQNYGIAITKENGHSIVIDIYGINEINLLHPDVIYQIRDIESRYFQVFSQLLGYYFPESGESYLGLESKIKRDEFLTS